jgi:hypothetical protein
VKAGKSEGAESLSFIASDNQEKLGRLGEMRQVAIAIQRQEPYDGRLSRTVLREPWGEIPLGYSTFSKDKEHNSDL